MCVCVCVSVCVCVASAMSSDSLIQPRAAYNRSLRRPRPALTPALSARSSATRCPTQMRSSLFGSSLLPREPPRLKRCFARAASTRTDRVCACVRLPASTCVEPKLRPVSGWRAHKQTTDMTKAALFHEMACRQHKHAISEAVFVLTFYSC